MLQIRNVRVILRMSHRVLRVQNLGLLFGFMAVAEQLIFSACSPKGVLAMILDLIRHRRRFAVACVVLLLTTSSQIVSAAFVGVEVKNPFIGIPDGWDPPTVAPYTLPNGVKVVAWGDENNNDGINSAFTSIISPTGSVSLLKAEFKETDPGVSDDIYDSLNQSSNTGIANANYLTDYSTSGGLSAKVTWNSSSGFYYDIKYAAIKDGNSSPNWFVFDLTGATWDRGRGFIDFVGPWFYKGSGNRQAQQFSHIELYGSNIARPVDSGGPTIPEPSSVLLFALGVPFACLHVRRRMR